MAIPLTASESFLYDRTVTILRTDPHIGRGTGAYSGLRAADEKVIFEDLPATIQIQRGGDRNPANLPTDTKRTEWFVLMPARVAARGQIRRGDIIIDDVGDRYTVNGEEWSQLGWLLMASREVVAPAPAITAPVEGAAIGQGDASGVLHALIGTQLGGQAPGAGAAAGVITTTPPAPLTGQGAGQGTGAGTVTATPPGPQPVAGQAAGVGAGSGTLTAQAAGTQPLTGTATGEGAGTGALGVTPPPAQPLTGAAAGQGAAGAGLTATPPPAQPLAGQASGQGTGQGGLSSAPAGSQPLTGQAAGQGAGSGSVTSTPPSAQPLTGSGAGAGAASGGITATPPVPLSGAAAGQGVAQGELVTPQDSETYLPALSSSPYVAIGARRMVSGYSGSIFRLRRASDSATMEVAAGASALPDYSAISAWAGGSLLTVAGVYNQVDGVFHAAEATREPPFDLDQAVAGRVPFIWDADNTSPYANTRVLSITGLSVNRNNFTLFDVVDPFNSIATNLHWCLQTAGNGNVFTLYQDQSNPGALMMAGVGFDRIGVQPRAQLSLIGLRSNGANTVLHMRENTYTGPAQSSSVGDVLRFGRFLNASTDPLNARQRRWGTVVYPALSDADVATLKAALIDMFDVPTSFDRLVVFDGDSIMQQFFSTRLRNTPYYAVPQITGTPEVYNLAVAGYSIGMLYGHRALAWANLPVASYPVGKRIWLEQAGINDLGSGRDPSSGAYNDLINLVAHVKGLGFKVGVRTILPTTTGDYGTPVATIEANRNTYNNLVLANTAGADFISNAAAHPIMGVYPDGPNNTTYFNDKLHFTSAGHQAIAAIDAAAINAAGAPTAALTGAAAGQGTGSGGVTVTPPAAVGLGGSAAGGGSGQGALSTGAAAWQPSDDPANDFLWRRDMGVTAGDPGTVSSWASQIGSYVATRSTAGNPPRTDVVPGGINFTGTQALYVPDLTGNGTITVASLVRVPVISGIDGANIWSSRLPAGDPTANGLSIRVQGDRRIALLRTGNANLVTSTEALTVPVNQWCVVRVHLNQETGAYKIFLNGQLVGSGVIAGTPLFSSGPATHVRIGNGYGDAEAGLAIRAVGGSRSFLSDQQGQLWDTYLAALTPA